MKGLSWLKKQLENFGNSSECKIDRVTLEELFIKAEKLNRSKGLVFEIKPEHLLLLKNSKVVWRDCEFGAPAINCKRPYGDTTVISDIAEILNWKKIDEEMATKLHRDLETVLQIILTTQKFEPGLYFNSNEYDSHGWFKL